MALWYWNLDLLVICICASHLTPLLQMIILLPRFHNAGFCSIRSGLDTLLHSFLCLISGLPQMVLHCIKGAVGTLIILVYHTWKARRLPARTVSIDAVNGRRCPRNTMREVPHSRSCCVPLLRLILELFHLHHCLVHAWAP